MLVNYFKLKNISSRGKVIALSIVGGVFILVTLFSIWNRNFADTLVGYLPNETIFYTHFSRPKISDSTKVDQILTKIFLDFGLTNYDSLDINREVAVVGALYNDQVKYGIIFKTDRPDKVKKILISSKIKYKLLSYNRFLITSEDLVNNYQINKKNPVAVNIKKRFYPLSTVNIYVSSQFFSLDNQDLNLDMAYSLLKNENSDLILSFKAKGDELKMFYGGISSVVNSRVKLESQSLKENIDGDIVFSSSDFYGLLDNWKNNLESVSIDDYNSFISGKLNIYLNTYLSSDNRNILLVASKNDINSGWLFGDYDFYISVDNIYSGKIEEILKSIMASKYPVIKNVYLSDGTKVAELLPDIEQFSFLEKNGIKYLYSPDDKFKLMYKSEGNNVAISNSELLINQNWPKLNYNYLKFKSDFLFNNGLGQYLKFFEFLEVNGQGIILK